MLITNREVETLSPSPTLGESVGTDRPALMRQVLEKRVPGDNMAIANFEDTALGLKDCVEALELGEHRPVDVDELNEYEKEGLRRLFAYAERLTRMANEYEDV